MRYVILDLFLLVSFVSGCVAAGRISDARTDSTWHTYSNARYNYTMLYPDGYEVYPTGSDSTRDGRTFRIVVKERSASLEYVNVQVYPRVAFETTPPPASTAHADVEIQRVRINGLSARQVNVREKATGQLAEVLLYRDGVRFNYQAGVEVRDFRGTMWWRIVSSFSFGEVK